MSGLAGAGLSGLKLEARLKTFVDRADVRARFDKATLGLLGRVGAFVRRRAQTSMRKRNGPSKPGSPPSVHQGLLRKLILFGVESGRGGHTLVVGSTRGNQRHTPTTPELHEAGGVRRLPARRATFKQKPGRDSRGKFVTAGTHTVLLPAGEVHYPARPYMAPAWEHTRTGKLSAQLKDFLLK